MEQIQKTTLERAIKMLGALPVKFAVVVDLGDGNGQQVLGNADLVDKEFLNSGKKAKSKHNDPRYPHGERSGHIRSHIALLQVNEVGYVPVGDYEPNRILSQISSWGVSKWGRGNVTCCYRPETQKVEVLRLA